MCHYALKCKLRADFNMTSAEEISTPRRKLGSDNTTSSNIKIFPRQATSYASRWKLLFDLHFALCKHFCFHLHLQLSHMIKSQPEGLRRTCLFKCLWSRIAYMRNNLRWARLFFASLKDHSNLSQMITVLSQIWREMIARLGNLYEIIWPCSHDFRHRIPNRTISEKSQN